MEGLPPCYQPSTSTEESPTSKLATSRQLKVDRSTTILPAELPTTPASDGVTPARVKDGNHLVVCEGMIDALSAASTGTQAVAVLGATYIDDGVAREIAKSAAGRQVVLALDGDHAGRSASDSLAASLTSAGCPNRVLSLPDGCDVNTMLGKDDRWIDRQLDLASARHSVRQHELARTMR